MDHQLDKYSLTTNLFKEFVLQTTVFNTTQSKIPAQIFHVLNLPTLIYGMVVECFYVQYMYMYTDCNVRNENCAKFECLCIIKYRHFLIIVFCISKIKKKTTTKNSDIIRQTEKTPKVSKKGRKKRSTHIFFAFSKSSLSMF